MEGESNGMEGSKNRQCQAGCGYFGSPATDGMCSICFKDVVKKKQQPPAGSFKITSPQRLTPPVDTRTSPSPFIQPSPKPVDEAAKVEEIPETLQAAAAAVGFALESSLNSENAAGSETKKKSTRCQSCRKKVGLTGFECRCGGLYCSVHRYSDKHDCEFDYRQLGADEIRRNNPVVVSEKINKI